MGKSKIIYDGNVLLDLTADTVVPATLLSGYTAHDKAGDLIEGTCTYDADTSDATAVASELLSGKSAYVNGVKVNGSMPNRGAISETISTINEIVTPAVGYHDGSGSVGIDPIEKAKLVPENIRKDITVLGVLGTMEGTESVRAQAKTATPSSSQQTITPDSGYNYLSSVTVAAIPYTETDNVAGGKTVTIG